MRWWGALLLVLAPIPLLLGAVEWLGVNTLIADEFYYVDFIRLVREGGDWTPWIWLQHNEHRVVPMKLLMVLLAGPTRWSQLAEMLCSVGLSALIVLVLWRVYRASGATSGISDLLAFAPVAWLVCSLSQYENQFFGMMVCHYFTALGAVLSLWLLARRGWVSVELAVLAAIVGALSIVNGFLVFPAGIAVLAAQRASWGRWAAWYLGGAAAFARYLWDYITPPHTQAFQWTVTGAYRIVKLALATMGAPLAAGSVAWGITLGVALLAVAVFVAFRWLRADPVRREKDALAVSLLLFGLASCAMVAAGRAFMNGDPLGSRYITYTNLAWIGVYLLVLGRVRNGGNDVWKIAAWSLLVPGILAANLHGLAQARLWHDQRLLDQYVLQTFTLQSDPVVGRLGPPQNVRQAATYLKAARLSAFAEPQRIVMLMNATTAKPSGEILRGQAVEQRLICPVGELHDVGIMILPAARPETSSFVVTVTSGGRELVRRSFETASIREWTWVQVPLGTPLRRCAGRDLAVRIESLDTKPGSGVLVLANEPNYEGELLQAGTPIPDRRLGMALNAFRFGVLH